MYHRNQQSYLESSRHKVAQVSADTPEANGSCTTYTNPLTIFDETRVTKQCHSQMPAIECLLRHTRESSLTSIHCKRKKGTELAA